MNEHEEAFVRAFIVAGKRERYLRLLPHPKRRAAILERLNHNLDLDYARATRIPPSERHANIVQQRLERLGAGERCYVIADASELDGQDLPLKDALTAFYGRPSFGVILSCVPGRLAFYKEEDIGEHYILQCSK